MEQSRHRPKPILPVAVVFTVANWPVGVGSGRWARGRRRGHREDAGSGRHVVDDGSLEVLVQLADLQLEVVHRAFDVRLPRLERGRHFLDPPDPRLVGVVGVAEAGLPLRVEVGEALLPLGVALVELIKDKLRVGIHGAQTTTESGEVIVGGSGIQDR